jgi:hypothetical protein
MDFGRDGLRVGDDWRNAGGHEDCDAKKADGNDRHPWCFSATDGFGFADAYWFFLVLGFFH